MVDLGLHFADTLCVGCVMPWLSQYVIDLMNIACVQLYALYICLNVLPGEPICSFLVASHSLNNINQAF